MLDDEDVVELESVLRSLSNTLSKSRMEGKQHMYLLEISKSIDLESLENILPEVSEVARIWS